MSKVWKLSAILSTALAVGVAGWITDSKAQIVAAQPSASTSGNESTAPEALFVTTGQIHTLDVEAIQRVAIGDPNIVDVTIISPTQLLVQAKESGATNLILWDAQGERQYAVTVIDPSANSLAGILPPTLEQIGLGHIAVESRGGKVFLIGEVLTDSELVTLEQVAASYPNIIINLVKVAEEFIAPEGPAPLVKLSVQVIELSRSDVNKLGIDWSDSMTLTQPATGFGTDQGDQTLTEALMRFGTGLGRSSISSVLNALVEEKKARVLSEPSLMTSSGTEASSFIGVEVPVIQDASLQAGDLVFSIEFRETGVLLRITPTVVEDNGERKITTLIQAEVSEVTDVSGLTLPVGSQTVTIPAFKVRNASTEVTTSSGETIVIAGLLELSDSNATESVPGLGSIPVLGRLFRSPSIETSELELIITVTPELVVDEELKMDRSMEIEQALSVAEVTASVDDPRLRYALSIQQEIARQLRFPQREKELSLDGSVKVRLHLFSDGTIGRVLVSESSGIEAFDLEALKAAETAAPYPPFSSEIVEDDLWLEVPVLFRP